MSKDPSDIEVAAAAPAARRTRQARVVWGDQVVTVGATRRCVCNR